MSETLRWRKPGAFARAFSNWLIGQVRWTWNTLQSCPLEPHELAGCGRRCTLSRATDRAIAWPWERN